MNYLLPLALILFLSNNKNGQIKDLLSSIPLSEVAPLIQMLNLPPETVENLVNMLTNFSNGNSDLLTIVKTVLPLLISFNKVQDDKTTCASVGTKPLYEIAPESVINSINDYFA